jgi:hypothetical protein
MTKVAPAGANGSDEDNIRLSDRRRCVAGGPNGLGGAKLNTIVAEHLKDQEDLGIVHRFRRFVRLLMLESGWYDSHAASVLRHILMESSSLS